ncbi:putative P-loop containing nucleoside triphosphate hydrolase, leucine-rich repeat domain, L [Rosa chinensis]|uniref:Putative P-loop containing nucleoside triphosphate hydrolase, leucine-rich repeat domain, L n=1 Tax=Rosa chinensis TaxID=74649 RepID=A0A2P6SKU8_ROSCH|nr:putative disease resistance protein RGA3 [Rosa chinensis]XP_040365585.1 putative disease resistance protein RGA3 [Rosa chinensis]XP_040365588.1 putative disease resistance protein RGA3 [Rosa chinensis]XP_040365591.1 putative disease resistance protein RGA3 [Rosa chinensis]XP_040365592.1 putative disease resistance protein RGA3 [Rosa chinensis]XP_040365593.1 putative disease resistance protein RGA3 [Rosa chinensis]XP_040365597.1 putative disease resistance protein RGA3 [Rosa chinensis]XP_0
MAEVLVNVLLERLATITLDKVGGEFKLVTGVEKEVKSLTRNLEAIQAVLEDAEQRQVTEATVRRWLSVLTEVSFDMDDVLDEWITEVLKQQMEKQEKQGENALIVTTKKKVCFPFLSSCFCFGQVNQLMLRHDIAVRIKDLNERIASIAKEKQDFSFQNITRVSELPERPKTTSLPNVKTFGRDEEKSLIASKLLSESSEGNEVPLIIPIVGMGGMGKTTLAQFVYNDEEVKSHFNKRIWVCVSDPFDEIKIAQAIIEEIDKDNSSKSSNVLQTLTQCIYKLIKGKKFLLVLDDVWSPNSDQWEELIKPLRYGATGSRVLVTTRKEEVATLMKATTTQMISLKALSDAFCLSLFYYSANMDENNVSKEYKDIGLKIVKRCNGLPLAAKTLGSLMRNKKKIHEWQAVLQSKTWELKEIQQDVFRPLLLSYHDLTPATKRCLLYCVTFPKDYVYDRNYLIELWMSQDYLNDKDNKEKIVVGQNYFDDLAMRSFFQDIEVDDENGNIKCKIHDIVHDFLQYLTKHECLILDFELDASERRDVSKDNIRHLTLVHATGNESLAHFLLNCKKLRTLMAIDSSKNSIGPLFELIVQLKCLRTLSLCGRWRESSLREIPETIGGLIHLRYLDLSDNNELEELPSSLGSLYNLQTLRLVECWNLKEIPETIGGLIHIRYLDLSKNNKLEKLPSALGSLYNLQTLRLVCCLRLKKVDVRGLINLRHLYVEECEKLELIKGIEQLTDMQRLDEFHVGDGDEENKLVDLKDLNQLQGSLDIRIRGNPNMAENAAAIMVNKAHLLQLRLVFPLDSDEGESREIMNGLEPHPSLESLSIDKYRGGAFSHWLLSLASLRMLSLETCTECGVLPPLGKLASLESLSISNLARVSKVGIEFLGIDDVQTSSSSIFISFPKLEQLHFFEMWSWEEWVGVENNNITIMPRLSYMTIHGCDKLKGLPDFLRKTPLRDLDIRSSFEC